MPIHEENLAEFQAKYSLEDSPDVIELLPGQKFAISGDIHGDYKLLLGRLRAARVIQKFPESPSFLPSPDSIQWEPNNNTILVQAGDVLDRGYNELECLELLARLSRQAASYGGAVIVLFGNHEFMNMLGDFRCSCDTWCTNDLMVDLFKHHCGDDAEKNYTFHHIFDRPNFPIRWVACEPGGLLASCFFAQCKVVVQVGHSVCVHAHWNEDCSKAYPCIKALNQNMRDFVSIKVSKDIRAGERHNKNATRYVRALPNDQVAWARPKHPERIVTKELLKHFPGANRLIVGHDRHREIQSLNSGVLWHIDTPNVVEILQVAHDDQVTIWKPNGEYVLGRDREQHLRVLVPLTAYMGEIRDFVGMGSTGTELPVASENVPGAALHKKNERLTPKDD